jgi:hypothetical protein
MSKGEKKLHFIGIKLTDREYEVLERLCDVQHRTKSSLIVHLLYEEADRLAQELEQGSKL